jgi:hypothetical protein
MGSIDINVATRCITSQPIAAMGHIDINVGDTCIAPTTLAIIVIGAGTMNSIERTANPRVRRRSRCG